MPRRYHRSAPILRRHHQERAGDEGGLCSCLCLHSQARSWACPKCRRGRLSGIAPVKGASPPPNLGRWDALYATGAWPRGGGQDKGYEGGDLNRAQLERFRRGHSGRVDCMRTEIHISLPGLSPAGKLGARGPGRYGSGAESEACGRGLVEAGPRSRGLGARPMTASGSECPDVGAGPTRGCVRDKAAPRQSPLAGRTHAATLTILGLAQPLVPAARAALAEAAATPWAAVSSRSRRRHFPPPLSREKWGEPCVPRSARGRGLRSSWITEQIPGRSCKPGAVVGSTFKRVCAEIWD